MKGPDLLTRSIGYLPQLLDGALTTLLLSAVAVCCGFFVGVFVYTMSVSDSRLMRATARVYVSVLRGTPVLAQLLVFYYVPSALGLALPGLAAAVIGLSLNTGAYQSQILGAGFRSIAPGQIEAASTFNLTRRQTLWHIEVPQVVRATLPALVSEMIDIVKASAVVSVISVTDLMRVGQQLSSSTYRPLEVYALAAVFYLAITSLLAGAGHVYALRATRRA
ncbi:amino acid ABC transporter permease [Caballeronia sp. AZ10_KS36]|uniref:amino acid ABC transporter permease n=1 Tax=Caballeronia sp. AZ10_KS36 TaxID=2921757 RepID=UPI002027EA4A|nr:amino acid ABC transporter permease [Caballeronia sp. AZ10_KS36]